MTPEPCYLMSAPNVRQLIRRAVPDRLSLAVRRCTSSRRRVAYYESEARRLLVTVDDDSVDEAVRVYDEGIAARREHRLATMELRGATLALERSTARPPAPVVPIRSARPRAPRRVGRVVRTASSTTDDTGGDDPPPSNRGAARLSGGAA